MATMGQGNEYVYRFKEADGDSDDPNNIINIFIYLSLMISQLLATYP